MAAEGPDRALALLHDELAAANAEAEALLMQWRMDRTDDELLERYNAAQEKALAVGRRIAALRRQHRP
jgi:hypothetical protein